MRHSTPHEARIGPRKRRVRWLAAALLLSLFVGAPSFAGHYIRPGWHGRRYYWHGRWYYGPPPGFYVAPPPVVYLPPPVVYRPPPVVWAPPPPPGITVVVPR